MLVMLKDYYKSRHDDTAFEDCLSPLETELFQDETESQTGYPNTSQYWGGPEVGSLDAFNLVLLYKWR